MCPNRYNNQHATHPLPIGERTQGSPKQRPHATEDDSPGKVKPLVASLGALCMNSTSIDQRWKVKYLLAPFYISLEGREIGRYHRGNRQQSGCEKTDTGALHRTASISLGDRRVCDSYSTKRRSEQRDCMTDHQPMHTSVFHDRVGVHSFYCSLVD
jgi:hypothetical protein